VIVKVIFLILSSYLIGSIPTAYILAKILRGIDIRKFGSGNIGATNAFRVLGVAPGIFVLIFDLFKGFFPVAFLVNLLNSEYLLNTSFLRILSGLASVIGHNWTVFLGFKGGKGIATSLGVFLGLTLNIVDLRIVLGLTLFSWICIFLITGFVSLASILSSIILVVLVFFFQQPREIVILALILCLFIIIRHRPNIVRLLERKELRTKFFK
jgi:glycerol-3-phosphate acyltransferase PlsY